MTVTERENVMTPRAVGFAKLRDGVGQLGPRQAVQRHVLLRKMLALRVVSWLQIETLELRTSQRDSRVQVMC